MHQRRSARVSKAGGSQPLDLQRDALQAKSVDAGNDSRFKWSNRRTAALSTTTRPLRAVRNPATAIAHRDLRVRALP